MAPKAVRYEIGLPRPASGVLRVLLRTVNLTSDDDVLTPTRLNQRREAKERKVRGLH